MCQQDRHGLLQLFSSRAVENPRKYVLTDLVTDKGKPLKNSSANWLAVVIKNIFNI